MKKLREWVENPLFIGVTIFLVMGFLTQHLNRLAGIDLHDMVLVLNGLLGDIVIFAVLIVWLNRRREHKERLRGYVEMLEDFRFWESEEGVNRKVGLLRRLQQLQAELPSLSRMALGKAYLKGFELSGVDLTHANLAQAFLLDCRLTRARLSHANLERAYLQGAILEQVEGELIFAAYVDFRSANLRGAQLRLANLEGAVLWNACLVEANFEGTYLHQTDLASADLTDARCAKARFGTANLKGASLKNCDLRGSDLSQVEGLLAEQLEAAYIDEQTLLPAGFGATRDSLLVLNRRPAHAMPDLSSSPSYRKSGQERSPMTLTF
jgi:uncharacterized protein YjbI with pentapeptide repeats